MSVVEPVYFIRGLSELVRSELLADTITYLEGWAVANGLLYVFTKALSNRMSEENLIDTLYALDDPFVKIFSPGVYLGCMHAAKKRALILG